MFFVYVTLYSLHAHQNGFCAYCWVLFCPLNGTFGFVALSSSTVIHASVSACLFKVNLFWTTPSISYSSRAKCPLEHTAVAIR